MAPQQQKSKDSASQRSEREIDALLKRLHSGCRFIQFEDVHKNDISNILRNATHPDEVHSELGRALAHSYMTSLDDDVGERVLLSLCCGEDTENSNSSNQQQTDNANYASAANAFFSSLAEHFIANRQHQIRSKWVQWCVRCEELVSPTDGSSINNGGGRSVLFACLKNYSLICFGNSSVGGCEMVYRSLKRSTSRMFWIRSVAIALEAAITALGSESEEACVLFQDFHPLFETCILQARKKIKLHDLGAHNEESRLILNESLRICTMNLHNDRSVCQFTMKMIEYLTKSLVAYLDHLVYTSSTNVHESVAVLDLSYEWLRGLSDLIRSASTKDLDDDNTKRLATAIDTITFTILPQLSSSMSLYSIAFELTPIYSTIAFSISSLEQYSNFTTANSVLAMRLGTLALSLKSDREVNGVCDLLLSIFSRFIYEETLVYTDISFVGGILYALGCVFASRPHFAKKALTMKQCGEKLMQRTPTVLDLSVSSTFSLVGEENSLIDLLAEMKSDPLSTNYQHLIDVISKSISNVGHTELHSWRRRPLALEDQCSGLLAGLTLLHMSVMSPSPTEYGYQCTLESLASFLDCYPHAASRVLPSVFDTLRKSSQQSAPLPNILSNSIKFIASKPIVSDPHGAHLAWTYLSPLMGDGVPAATRASIIRVLPQMCLNNRKLFRRIRDVIGKSMISTDPIIRIAATASLSDMSRLDLLRDVEGIVSWVQSRLIDEESTVTYYALSTLRYLVQNEELDFDLVVRVLEKRLSLDLGSVDNFLGWDVLVLEILVELLGEGGLEEEEDDDESGDEEEEKVGGPEPTAKTVKAVSLLIELALKIDSDERYDLSTQARIMSKIYQSLANYSALILGLDSESIRTCADATSIPEDLSGDWDRYLEFKKLVQGGINLATRMQDEAKDDDIDSVTTEFSNNLVATIQFLLSFEEDTFGSFVFRKGSSSSKGKNEGAHQHRVSKSVLSALPQVSTVRSMFENDESVSARAAAYFYALGTEDDNGPIPQTSALLAEMTECISHFAPPADSPASYAMQVFSIMSAMTAVFRSMQNADENSREQLFETAVEQLDEWATEFSEYGYVALSALALTADDSPQFYTSISRVQNTILDGCDMFETEDVKLLCECMVAARLSRSADTRVVALINSVEKSIERHNGQSCFGGYLGLAIFVQSVSRRMRLSGSDPSEVWCREQTLRCICILVKSLNNCILTHDGSILKLASCIEKGKLTDTLSLPSELIIKDGAAQKLEGVVIGLSHCFPALAGVSTDLLKCVVSVVDELPWGSGKGFATHATYKTLIDAGVYSSDDLSGAIAATMACVQGFDYDCIDLSDSLFSLVSLCRLSSRKLKAESDLISETTERILSATSRMPSKGKTMAVFTRCASIGEIPGVTSFEPNIHSSVKKEQVLAVVEMLEETLSNGEVECTHASSLALGVLCAMRNSSQTIQQHKHEKKSDRKNVDVSSIIQGKGGTVMEFVLQQVAKSHSDILAQHSDTICAAKQLCILFEALEAVALPGSFGRVIETTLHSFAVGGTELANSSLKLLFSQIKSGRRRIGFDGRGFLDMSTRLTKLQPEYLRKLVGATGAQQMMAAIPNLLFQLPTSAGEEVAKCLWGICRDLSNHPKVMAEFFIGMKTIFASAGKESQDKSKLSTSPALLRALQNLIASGLFDEFCEVAALSSKIDATASSYATSIAAYLECLEITSASAINADDMGMQSDISYDNVLVMASCASFSSKQTRRVETWIARQNARDNPSDLRMLLLSSLAVAPQSRNDIEMKESIVNLLDVMLVAGVDNTLCIELIAAKVAYWWDSRNMNELSATTHPIQRVSSMSSFLVSSNLCFDAQLLPNKELTSIFHLFVNDLPAKLALLCQTWKISDDISNRATRLCKDATAENKKACLQRIIQLLDGGRE
jgi:hypothetical protein